MRTSQLCLSLKVFGIRYRYWLLDAEGDELTPLLRKIVKTRLKTDTPLQSVRFWPTKDTPDEAATELCGTWAENGTRVAGLEPARVGAFPTCYQPEARLGDSRARLQVSLILAGGPGVICTLWGSHTCYMLVLLECL